MVLPLEWEKDQTPAPVDGAGGGKTPSDDSDHTGDTTRAAMALLEEMEKNKVLQEHIEVAKSLFTVEQLAQWVARCQPQAVPC